METADPDQAAQLEVLQRMLQEHSTSGNTGAPSTSQNMQAGATTSAPSQQYATKTTPAASKTAFTFQTSNQNSAPPPRESNPIKRGGFFS